VWGVVQNTNFFTIRQHVKLFPKNCCACPPCVKQENTYSIYAGLNQDSQAEFLRVDEVSDDWNRCCCAPYHPVKVCNLKLLLFAILLPFLIAFT
jgi:hypothetical protein